MTYCRNLCLYLVAGMQILRAPMGTSAADNPCPDVFQYEGRSGSEYGIITVPNPYPYLAINISVETYITAPVPSPGTTKLKPVHRNVWRKLAAGSMDPVLYRLDFPVSSPLPTIKSITVNGDVICNGTVPDAGLLVIHTIQHAIFNSRCDSASLQCPFNIQQHSGGRQQQSAPLRLPRQYDYNVPNNADSSLSTSPCPGVFKYELDRSGEWYGIISVPNPYPAVPINISAQMYVAACISCGNGRLELVNDPNEEWKRMRTGERYSVLYRVDFPVQSPLATVNSITVNSHQMCRGSKPSSAALTTLSYKNSLFSQECTIVSLDCPDIIVQSGETPISRPTPSTPPPTTPSTSPQPPPPRPPPPPLRPPPITQPPRQSGMNTRCGRRALRTNPLIFSGQDTTPGQWPWHVALYHYQGFDTVYKCGGTFVGTRTVITAAQCVTKSGRRMQSKDIIVYLGRYNLGNHNEQNVQQLDVRLLFVHEQFNYTNLHNDIALLVLNSAVEITAAVRPVCLWDAGDTGLQNIIGRNGLVVGWGLDEFGMTADKLKMLEMPVVSQSTCIKSNILFYSVFTHETTFCAGFRNGSSVCNGDSGGGMVFPEMQSDGIPIWLLRGIVSNGMPDEKDNTRCNINNYIIFTDIAPYLGWINSVIM